jgi:hypothetical protein
MEKCSYDTCEKRADPKEPLYDYAVFADSYDEKPSYSFSICLHCQEDTSQRLQHNNTESCYYCDRDMDREAITYNDDEPPDRDKQGALMERACDKCRAEKLRN